MEQLKYCTPCPSILPAIELGFTTQSSYVCMFGCLMLGMYRNILMTPGDTRRSVYCDVITKFGQLQSSHLARACPVLTTSLSNDANHCVLPNRTASHETCAAKARVRVLCPEAQLRRRAASVHRARCGGGNSGHCHDGRTAQGIPYDSRITIHQRLEN